LASFWDTESFVLPVLTYTFPVAAADALRWRHSTPRRPAAGRDPWLLECRLPVAHDRRRRVLRVLAGGHCAFHVNADIADAVVRYVDATGDEEFERDIGTTLWWRPPASGGRPATTTATDLCCLQSPAGDEVWLLTLAAGLRAR